MATTLTNRVATMTMGYSTEPWKPEGSRRPDSSRVPVGYDVPLRELPPEVQAQFVESVDNPPEPYAVRTSGLDGDEAVVEFDFRLSDETARRLRIKPLARLVVAGHGPDAGYPGRVSIHWSSPKSGNDRLFSGSETQFCTEGTWVERADEAIGQPGRTLLELLEGALDG
ncbi:hypothetical protein BPNPMPFG_006306 [Mesorhizobium sp. AR07]|uniref:hypothetical protein n=1 Tax=Mesorhizobium sp. AR07 TaxID=2865838 RepID=UPI0021610203|nr:hypothetical protein [Mesorhizobium sp. AR07]UVK44391.1 hypothetical protein BPNPMPFG_006306 [Mesorhizobium sp. AR07]